jgi:hypothetical protein
MYRDKAGLVSCICIASSGKEVRVIGLVDWLARLFWAVLMVGVVVAFVARAHINPRERKRSGGNNIAH